MSTAEGTLIVFVHIPRTGGTTLRSLFETEFGSWRVRPTGNVFKGGGGVERDAPRRKIGRYANAGWGRVSVLRGHVPYSWRELFPPDARYVTVLREPLSRALSHQRRMLPDLRSLPDLQTRMLCDDPEPYGDVTDAMLDQAKHNLEHSLTMFGLTERYNESLVLMRDALGLRNVLFRERRETTPDRTGGPVPDGQALAAENRYDVELYRFASELFERRSRAAGPALATDAQAIAVARHELAESDVAPDVARRARELALDYEIVRHETKRAMAAADHEYVRELDKKLRQLAKQRRQLAKT